jgi:hypothetical protein
LVRPPCSHWIRYLFTALAACLLLAGPAVAAPLHNVIVNGDFEAGNIGFTSDYPYSPGNMWPPSVYDVSNTGFPSVSHPLFIASGDHTSGQGNYLTVNGSTTAGQVVWSQTVSVFPNSYWTFTAWVSSLYWQSPANLEIHFQGNDPLNPEVVGTFLAPSVTGVWEPITMNWLAGSDTTLTISIINLNLDYTGNDFALDDIALVDPPPPEVVPQQVVVPEPATLVLFGAGLACLGGVAVGRRWQVGPSCSLQPWG